MKKDNKKEKNSFISKEQMRKLERAARRQIDLERGTFIRTGAHKTSKDDEEERYSKTISKQELEEILEEEEWCEGCLNSYTYCSCVPAWEFECYDNEE